jgi:hypothetical protein
MAFVHLTKPHPLGSYIVDFAFASVHLYDPHKQHSKSVVKISKDSILFN